MATLSDLPADMLTEIIKAGGYRNVLMLCMANKELQHHCRNPRVISEILKQPYQFFTQDLSFNSQNLSKPTAQDHQLILSLLKDALSLETKVPPTTYIVHLPDIDDFPIFYYQAINDLDAYIKLIEDHSKIVEKILSRYGHIYIFDPLQNIESFIFEQIGKFETVGELVDHILYIYVDPDDGFVKRKEIINLDL